MTIFFLLITYIPHAINEIIFYNLNLEMIQAKKKKTMSVWTEVSFIINMTLENDSSKQICKWILTMLEIISIITKLTPKENAKRYLDYYWRFPVP